MSSKQFRFMRFTIRHDQCAMKVGTDGVLLGAWAYVDGCQNVLDVGCGSGVVSLMVAQRNRSASVCGVELDGSAARQAMENVSSSVFSGRITILEADIRTFRGQFDCIVCNPPFYADDVCSPDSGRAMARSVVTLSSVDLWHAVSVLSGDGAFFNVILPYERLAQYNILAIDSGFSVRRLCRVHTKEGKPPKRVMVTYCKGRVELAENGKLVLQKGDGTLTEEYRRLTKDFYLPVT